MNESTVFDHTLAKSVIHPELISGLNLVSEARKPVIITEMEVQRVPSAMPHPFTFLPSEKEYRGRKNPCQLSDQRLSISG